MKGQAANKTIRMSIDSRFENVSLIGLAIQAYCSYISMDDVEGYKTQLCVVEAVNNAIRHAYGSRSGHLVEVAISIRADLISIEISDNGRPMVALSKRDLDFEVDNIDDLPENGMGLFIIQNFMDEVRYETLDGKNILRMTKRLVSNR